MDTKPAVAVAMSGGVDSSVTAALLVEQGFSVIGIMLRLWNEIGADRFNRCCTPDAVSQARRVALILSIPFYVLDAKQAFYDNVVKPFIYDYTHNLTPNPCISCNRLIRWGFLLNYILASGADFLATGHYTRTVENSDRIFHLMRGVDPLKDQSYILHVLSQDQLAHTLFPLGKFRKTEVRLLAKQYNLPVVERPDSQDLCFVGAGDYRQFLDRHAPDSVQSGDIVDVHGEILGRHQGLPYYTIGQRRGLRIAAKDPVYVLEKDFINNRIIVGSREQSGHRGLIAGRINWIAGQPPASPFNGQVKIRYNARDIPALIEVMDEQRIKVQFDEPICDVTPGQAAVLYNGEECLGGGIIINHTQ